MAAPAERSVSHPGLAQWATRGPSTDKTGAVMVVGWSEQRKRQSSELQHFTARRGRLRLPRCMRALEPYPVGAASLAHICDQLFNVLASRASSSVPVVDRVPGDVSGRFWPSRQKVDVEVIALVADDGHVDAFGTELL